MERTDTPLWVAMGLCLALLHWSAVTQGSSALRPLEEMLIDLGCVSNQM